MTIAAAMRCAEGVIVCADSLASGGDVNLSQSKIVCHNLPKLRANIAVAFSGTISHCMSAISSLFLRLNKLPASKAPLTEELFRSELEDVLAKFFRKHMYPDPHYNTWNGDLVCLLAVVQDLDTRRTFILSTEKTVANLHGDAAFIGSGAALARYIAEPLVCISVAGMPKEKVLLMADHMLQQVKQFVPGCGDESHFFFISNTSGFCPLTRTMLLSRERSDTFREVVAELFYASADLDFDDDLVRIGMHMTDKRIKQIREEQRAERERRAKLGPTLFDKRLIGRGPFPMEPYNVRPPKKKSKDKD